MKRGWRKVREVFYWLYNEGTFFFFSHMLECQSSAAVEQHSSRNQIKKHCQTPFITYFPSLYLNSVCAAFNILFMCCEEASTERLITAKWSASCVCQPRTTAAGASASTSEERAHTGAVPGSTTAGITCQWQTPVMKNSVSTNTESSLL